jgi:streptomycin 6-kinase
MVPSDFKNRIVGVHGVSGERWLKGLPALVAEFEKRWSLTIENTWPNPSYNFVSFGLQGDGTEVVLKLGLPNPELTNEIEVLRHYGGQGAVRLIDSDSANGAILLERLRPGQTLETMDEKKATIIAAKTMRRLLKPATSRHPFPTVSKWALGLGRLRERFDGATGPLPARLVEKAESLFEDLAKSSEQDILLHGDLHHQNILLKGTNEWLAIDPQGVIGEASYETARFLHNPIPGFLEMSCPGDVLLKRISIFADILRIDVERILGWGFFDTVLAAWWCIEDNDDGWEYFINCAEIFDQLVN